MVINDYNPFITGGGTTLIESPGEDGHLPKWCSVSGGKYGWFNPEGMGQDLWCHLESGRNIQKYRKNHHFKVKLMEFCLVFTRQLDQRGIVWSVPSWSRVEQPPPGRIGSPDSRKLRPPRDQENALLDMFLFFLKKNTSRRFPLDRRSSERMCLLAKST